MRAVQDDGSHRLGGRKVDVPDMQLAETVVVLAVADAGDATVPALCVVQRSTADDCADGPDGVRVTYQPTLDGTRRVAQVEFDGAPVSALAGADCISRVRRRAFAGLAAESVGVAQRALDLAVAHASSREQFGRPIGSYQAIAHRIVDVYVAVELARSLAYRAAWWVATTEDGSRVRGHTVGVAEVDGACAAAKAAASDAAVQACETLIQVLGGMGMTWEHPAHRLYKRALADRWYAGSPATHRAVLAAALLDD
jgi:alkylation response protein AidB-like acyl-CoA dehydrogenase